MIKILKNNFFILKYMVAYSPSYIIISVIMSLFTLYDTFVSVLLMKYIIDGITNKTPIHNILIVMLIVFLVGLAINIFNSWCSNIYFPKYGHGFKKYMHNILYDKALSLDIKCYDDPEFLNDYVWTMNDIDHRIFSVFTSLQSLLISIINIAFLVTVILTLDYVLIIFALCSVFCSNFLGTKLSKIKYEMSIANMTPQRIISYVQRVFYLRDYAKELRLSEMPVLIKKKFNEAITSLIDNVRLYGLKSLFLDVLLKICYFVFSVFGTLMYLTVRTYMGYITIGSYPALYNATTNLNNHLQSLFKFVSNAYENNLYIERFKKFLNYQPENKQGDRSIGNVEKIEFKNVMFSYDQKNNVLNDINFSVCKGEKIAIVGHNGAGKSTLVNLLLKLYFPSSGEIKINDININEFTTSEYLKKFCVVTQDYKLFAASIAENILCKSDISEDERKKVLNALKSVEIYNKVVLSPNDVDSQYSKEFYDDGLLFSGGEEQKLALSKIFATDAEIIVLDEPSSALDPVSEYNIFNKIKQQLKGKTIIFISHRLYSTTLADKIIVLDNGRISEIGSHNSLMEANGKYAELFKIQSERYVNDNEI